LAAKLAKDYAIDRVIRLLSESMETGREKLRNFLSAWMALEVFVEQNFKEYQQRFWDGLSAGVSGPVRERYLKRIHDVMSDKYRLIDRFIVVSAELDPAQTDSDVQIFQRAKDLRDDFSHGKVIDEKALPVTDIQSLVRKLLRLHIGRT
jgi:hypothetical protein